MSVDARFAIWVKSFYAGMLLRARFQLISLVEKGFITSSNGSGHAVILKVQLRRKAELTNKKSLLIFSLATMYIPDNDPRKMPPDNCNSHLMVPNQNMKTSRIWMFC